MSFHAVCLALAGGVQTHTHRLADCSELMNVRRLI